MEKLLNWTAQRLTELKLSRKTCALAMLVLFAVSLIPIYAVSFFTVPAADDYNFGYYNHEAVVNGGSYLAAAWRTMCYEYFHWQGFFQSSFWAAVQPFNINIHLYFLSNLLVITTVIAAFFYFTKTVLMNVFHLDKWDYLLIAVPMAAVYVQFLPSLWEGFYWMDGSMELFYAVVQVIMFAYIINYHLTGKKIYAVLSYVIMILFVATDIHLFIRMFWCCGFALFFAVPRKWKVSKLIYGLFAVNLVFFIISLLGPGNFVRREETGYYPFFLSCLYGISSAGDYIAYWMNGGFIAVLIFISIAFAFPARKMQFEFRYPAVLPLMGFGLCAGDMAAHYFAIGIEGSFRQANQYYFLFCLWAGASALYFTGWLVKRKTLVVKENKGFSAGLLISLALLLGFAVNNYGIREVSTPGVVLAFVRGRVQTYHQEMWERIKLYEDPSIQDVEVRPLSVDIPFLGNGSLETDPEFWANESVAEYYGKRSVRLVLPEEMLPEEIEEKTE